MAATHGDMTTRPAADGARGSTATTPAAPPRLECEWRYEDGRIDWARFRSTIDSLSRRPPTVTSSSTPVSSGPAEAEPSTWSVLVSPKTRDAYLLHLLGLNFTHYYDDLELDYFGLDSVVQYSALLLLQRDYELASGPLPFSVKRSDDLNEAVAEVLSLPFLLDLYRIDAADEIDDAWKQDKGNRVKAEWVVHVCLLKFLQQAFDRLLEDVDNPRQTWNLRTIREKRSERYDAVCRSYARRKGPSAEAGGREERGPRLHQSGRKDDRAQSSRAGKGPAETTSPIERYDTVPGEAQGGPRGTSTSAPTSSGSTLGGGKRVASTQTSATTATASRDKDTEIPTPQHRRPATEDFDRDGTASPTPVPADRTHSAGKQPIFRPSSRLTAQAPREEHDRVGAAEPPNASQASSIRSTTSRREPSAKASHEVASGRPKVTGKKASKTQRPRKPAPPPKDVIDLTLTTDEEDDDDDDDDVDVVADDSYEEEGGGAAPPRSKRPGSSRGRGRKHVRGLGRRRPPKSSSQAIKREDEVQELVVEVVRPKQSQPTMTQQIADAVEAALTRHLGDPQAIAAAAAAPKARRTQLHSAAAPFQPAIQVSPQMLHTVARLQEEEAIEGYSVAPRAAPLASSSSSPPSTSSSLRIDRQFHVAPSHGYRHAPPYYGQNASSYHAPTAMYDDPYVRTDFDATSTMPTAAVFSQTPRTTQSSMAAQPFNPLKRHFPDTIPAPTLGIAPAAAAGDDVRLAKRTRTEQVTPPDAGSANDIESQREVQGILDLSTVTPTATTMSASNTTDNVVLSKAPQQPSQLESPTTTMAAATTMSQAKEVEAAAGSTTSKAYASLLEEALRPPLDTQDDDANVFDGVFDDADDEAR
ncbi:uncharacterized protein PFL1_00496 [Pseudozyma flocculosa PF-1]|uniref:Uncharacterized protein n=1 Tax=Pseudozyma flocculosa TaxID=84751 RepID=A0A5C3EQW3_9BASI|nr:uncharacterized protein PFL1_00496 [Pseudozyma flocculosa PF-1]EPQ32300.1 hypothetical protein PFL1_00496 [Pseudozyma flocculosa PF-1]SPO34744.1 uncharacterized protein PSFLO_00215 [Pseudozyma flocculosa]